MQHQPQELGQRTMQL
ncbi:hypothetical protein QJQ45_021111 [Haematococcus lacustris]|nr:hypothetical protein QJQ45_021111 [Haematococcus lacustris]